MSNPNPMYSRCGLEDCDCEYTIGKLVEALRKIDLTLAPPGPWVGKVRQAMTTARLAVLWAGKRR